MPPKYNTELIQDLQDEVASLERDLAAYEKVINDTDLSRLRERVAVLEKDMQQVQQQKLESNRIKWQLVLVALGVLLTMVGSIIVNLAITAFK